MSPATSRMAPETAQQAQGTFLPLRGLKPRGHGEWHAKAPKVGKLTTSSGWPERSLVTLRDCDLPCSSVEAMRLEGKKEGSRGCLVWPAAAWLFIGGVATTRARAQECGHRMAGSCIAWGLWRSWERVRLKI